MKIIIAKQSGLDRTVFINANRISSFHSSENQYDGRIETKIYFAEGKCEIEGDKTEELCGFMASDDESGILNLVQEDERKSYWRKHEGSKQE